MIDRPGEVFLGVHESSIEIENQYGKHDLDEFLFLLESYPVFLDKFAHYRMLAGIELIHRTDEHEPALVEQRHMIGKCVNAQPEPLTWLAAPRRLPPDRLWRLRPNTALLDSTDI